MPNKLLLNQLFLNPLVEALDRCAHQRACKKHPDIDFLKSGLARCLEPVVSGREFLQLHFSSGAKSWKLSHYFETNKSERRAALAAEAASLIAAYARRTHSAYRWPDDLPELDGYDILLGDGHFHTAAVHDPKGPKGKIPVGQFFARHLRTGALHHIDTAVAAPGNTREHDMGMLKRQSTDALRMGAPKGRKVLYVWDRAGIDFGQWHKWKQAAGIYFLTRAKEGICNESVGENTWDRDDYRNNGVSSDTLVWTSSHTSVRRVDYTDPASGKEFVFVTNLPTKIPPGVIAWLYQRRWDVEKTFDETRNRLGEGKAWGSSVTAKRIQGSFISIAYNLLLILEDRLRKAGELPKEPQEEKRRGKRRMFQVAKAKAAGRKINYHLTCCDGSSQIGCKFIRWVKRHLSLGTSYAESVANLRLLYGEFS